MTRQPIRAANDAGVEHRASRRLSEGPVAMDNREKVAGVLAAVSITYILFSGQAKLLNSSSVSGLQAFHFRVG